MKKHPYLRAYMAGIVVPSVGLLIVLTVFIVMRIVMEIAIPFERVIVFPMAIVPTLFGLWNMLYLWLNPRHALPIGIHGALLPLIMGTCGVIAASSCGLLSFGSHGIIWFQAISIPYTLVIPFWLVVIAIYYLIWKYIVGFLNRMIEIA